MTKNERHEFLKASLASLAGAAAVSIPGCRSACYRPARIEPDKAAHREELTEKLKEIAEESPGEAPDNVGAMCYVPAGIAEMGAKKPSN